MSKRRKCLWKKGCSTILSSYNNSDLCRVHQVEDERRIQRERIKVSVDLSLKQIHNQKIKPENKLDVSRILGVVYSSHKISLDADRILEVVSSSYEVSKEDILGKRRTSQLAFPRQVVAYLIRADLQMSFPDIASYLGRDHTTIMYACNKITKIASNNLKFRKTLEVIRSQYKNPA